MAGSEVTPHCGRCGKENAVDSPYCVHCRARLGQERDHIVPCRRCWHARTWRRDALCDRCEEEIAAHEDEVGAEWAEEFSSWTEQHRDFLDVLELG